MQKKSRGESEGEEWAGVRNPLARQRLNGHLSAIVVTTNIGRAITKMHSTAPARKHALLGALPASILGKRGLNKQTASVVILSIKRETIEPRKKNSEKIHLLDIEEESIYDANIIVVDYVVPMLKNIISIIKSKNFKEISNVEINRSQNIISVYLVL